MKANINTDSRISRRSSWEERLSQTRREDLLLSHCSLTGKIHPYSSLASHTEY